MIQPKNPSDVGRLEKDPTKIDALYKEGYRDAAECFEQMIQYLES